MKNKLLIVQIENYHTQDILSQLDILDKTIEIDLYIPKNLEGSNCLRYYRINNIYYTLEMTGNKILNIIYYIIILLKLKLLYYKNKYEIILFNSIPENKIKLILLNIFKNRTKNIGIIHNVKKELCKYLRYLNKYVVLSREIYLYNKDIKNIDYFEPCIFDKIKIKNDLKIENDEILKIGIIGKTDYSKRNYKKLIEIMTKYRYDKLPIKIYIIGEVFDEFEKEIKYNKLENIIIYKKGFLSFEELLTISKQIDVIALLLDPETQWFKNYNKTKLSGAMNIIKYFNKPFIANENIIFLEPFDKNCIYYKESIEEIIIKIKNHELTKEKLKKYRIKNIEHTKYLENIKIRYLNLLK